MRLASFVGTQVTKCPVTVPTAWRLHVLPVPAAWTHRGAAEDHSSSTLAKVTISGDRVCIVRDASPVFLLCHCP
jgi:hypothetical protein